MAATSGSSVKEKHASMLKEVERKHKDSEKMKQLLTELTFAKQKLEVQRSENENVLKELKQLESDAMVHKLVGPVLIKQSKEEAETTVTKRLEYITGEKYVTITAIYVCGLCMCVCSAYPVG
eukprot:GHVQ01033181.1.p1 GENE.GHVQ01033181.1~~GHVQ01033181.1.p1  ORF type:complete len:122 (+),score=18.70 GHVQ01033181.1:100-465(+)